jgi:16S rRNA (guanine(966)-N(2))-methyltransferase RsmD
MRVIAGLLKGRRLRTPTWDGLRPTSDKLRGTLFNILAPRLARARVLDGYAGTGALGIEALSRGAAHVTFVDSDRRAQALIAVNLTACGIGNHYAIIRTGLARALAMLPADTWFDIILLDPPYDRLRRPERENVDDEVETMLTRAGAHLAPGGVLVLEHSRRRPVADAVGGLIRTRSVVSGDSMLTFYAWPP